MVSYPNANKASKSHEIHLMNSFKCKRTTKSNARDVMLKEAKRDKGCHKNFKAKKRVFRVSETRNRKQVSIWQQ